MPVVTLDPASGALVIGGTKVFPLGLSDAPPRGSQTPDGADAWTTIANGGRGANLVRTGRTIAQPWNLAQIDAEIAAEKTEMDAAATHGLYCWLRLVNAADLPPPATPPSQAEQLLTKIVGAFKDHPALVAYKGADEPQHGGTPPAGLVRAYGKLKMLDPDHPIVIVQAPVGQLAALTPYRPAFDVTGADIYPISYGVQHDTDSTNTDISVVGDVTKKMVSAAGGKPVWMTLQITWSGTIPTAAKPHVIPRFPSLFEQRFMTYQAIVDGARGLTWFGGQYTEVMRPRDAATGWNWTYWQLVLKPLFEELTSTAVQPALVAPPAPHAVATTASGIEVATRRQGAFLYVIAVKRGTTGVGPVQFTGLPARNDGSPIASGEVLWEYVGGAFRDVGASAGTFTDWFAPHDVHVYRFALG
jgi:hypothetical protein